ncbi:MAG: hypothetical protein M3237_17805 [Actinomycetota bacterium]|nr:hypothetical protein [Actinomycetota bacterium]
MTRVWTAALTLVLALAVVGCSDDGDGPQDPATVTATETETVTASPSPTEATSEPTETGPASPTGSAAPPPPLDLSEPPTTYAEAEAHLAAAVDAGGPPQELGRFQTGDEKFYCAFNDEFIPPSCEILDAVRDPETCADSPSPGVGRMELTRRGWAPQCNTDTIRQPGATVVAPGKVVTYPPASMRCVIEGFGLTCLATDDRKGFFIGPGRYQVF